MMPRGVAAFGRTLREATATRGSRSSASGVSGSSVISRVATATGDSSSIQGDIPRDAVAERGEAQRARQLRAVRRGRQRHSRKHREWERRLRAQPGWDIERQQVHPKPRVWERPTRRARRGRRDGELLARQRLLHGATSEQASLTWVVQAESRRVGSVRPCYVAPSGLQAPASRPRPDATAHRRLSGVRPLAHRSRLPHNP